MGASSFDKPPYLYEGKGFGTEKNPLKLDRPRKNTSLRKNIVVFLFLLLSAGVLGYKYQVSSGSTGSEKFGALFVLALFLLAIFAITRIPRVANMPRSVRND